MPSQRDESDGVREMIENCSVPDLECSIHEQSRFERVRAERSQRDREKTKAGRDPELKHAQ